MWAFGKAFGRFWGSTLLGFLVNNVTNIGPRRIQATGDGEGDLLGALCGFHQGVLE
jgi:hypothetical protein